MLLVSTEQKNNEFHVRNNLKGEWKGRNRGGRELVRGEERNEDAQRRRQIKADKSSEREEGGKGREGRQREKRARAKREERRREKREPNVSCGKIVVLKGYVWWLKGGWRTWQNFIVVAVDVRFPSLDLYEKKNDIMYTAVKEESLMKMGKTTTRTKTRMLLIITIIHHHYYHHSRLHRRSRRQHCHYHQCYRNCRCNSKCICSLSFIRFCVRVNFFDAC